MALVDLKVAREWEGWPAGSAGLDFDGNLEHYARGDAAGNISVRRVADDREVICLRGVHNHSSPHSWRIRFSSDGQFLVGGELNGRSQVWDVRMGTVILN